MDIDVETESFEVNEDSPLAQQGWGSDDDEEDYEDGEMEAEGSDSEDEDFGPEDGEDDNKAEEEYYGDL